MAAVRGPGPGSQLVGQLDCRRERGAALTSRLQSFETEMLAEDENVAGLAAINRELIAKGEAVDSPQRDYWLLLAESHLTRRLFRAMARRMDALPVPA